MYFIKVLVIAINLNVESISKQLSTKFLKATTVFFFLIPINCQIKMKIFPIFTHMLLLPQTI